MVSPPTGFVLASFAALFVTVNPIQSAAIFAALTEGGGPAYRRVTAVKSVALAAGVLALFALCGDDLLRFVGVSLSGVRVGGGILLMLVSIDIVFGRSIASPSPAAGAGADIAVFPLATPVIAGPAAITAVTVRSPPRFSSPSSAASCCSLWAPCSLPRSSGGGSARRG